MSAERIVGEVLVTKTNLKGSMQWRWGVTWQLTVDDRYPGVYDRRRHLLSAFGNTRTAWGAWRQVRKAYSQAPEYTEIPA